MAAEESFISDHANEFAVLELPVALQQPPSAAPLHSPPSVRSDDTQGTVDSNSTLCPVPDTISESLTGTQRDARGRTLLHQYALDGAKEKIQNLLSAGFPLDLKANDGNGPLHHAAARGRRRNH